jgi:hypothetical protein
MVVQHIHLSSLDPVPMILLHQINYTIIKQAKPSSFFHKNINGILHDSSPNLVIQAYINKVPSKMQSRSIIIEICFGEKNVDLYLSKENYNNDDYLEMFCCTPRSKTNFSLATISPLLNKDKLEPYLNKIAKMPLT